MMGLRAVKKQGGFTALELLVVLIVTVAALGLGSQYLMSYADTQVNQAAADHNKTVADAATKYTKDNYAAILATATSSSPAVITVPMLKSTGYLTSSVTDQNPYGQTYEIRALQPVANKLETLIVTLGGETIPEMDLRRIAQVSGARGGYISSTNTAVATGSYGGWQMPLANYGTSPGAGHLATALFFDDGALVSDYLYRNAVAGHPEFNRMNTAIDMNGNNINNAGTVNATTLNATGDTYTGGWFRSQGDTGWYSQKWGGGWYMSDSNWIRSVNDKNVYTAGQMQAGTMRSNGRLSTGEYLQVDGVAVENQPCGARTVGLDANGLTLSCQSGIWKRQFGNSFVLVSGNDPGCTGPSGFWNARSNASCPAGYTVVGVGYLQGSYCGYGNGYGLAGVQSYGTAVSVWPTDNYGYTFIAQATCAK